MVNCYARLGHSNTDTVLKMFAEISIIYFTSKKDVYISQ